MIRSILCLGIALCISSACSSTRHYISDSQKDWAEQVLPPDAELDYQVFLIGDAGGIDSTSVLLSELSGQLDAAGKDAAVVFLGDNIYCCGLPDSADVGREKAENRLVRQLEAVKDFEGRIYFIPGNHDWNSSKAGGLQALARQEKFVESYLDRGNTFRPDKGFPGPEEIKLTDRLTLVAIDTEWWLTKHDRSTGDGGDFEIEEEGDFLLALHEVVQDNDDEHVLVVGHHPMYSNGEHSGNVPFKTHLFPLTEFKDWAYVPLPILGSLGALYIRYVGTRQDLGNKRYKALREGMLRAFGEHESLIYAAGHEHNLQYFRGLMHDFIVSGSGTNVKHVSPGGKATFTSQNRGYTTLRYYKDGSVWITFWVLQPESTSVNIAFRTQLKGPARDAVDPEVPEAPRSSYPDYSDSTYVMAANPDYLAGTMYEFFLGRQNREIWGIPVEVPYLDLGRDGGGGLTPVKRGGGMQTFSLRLQGEDGYQYSLRSVDKDPSVSIPEFLRETVATEVVQDQIASIHPYGAYIIPKLAEAAGVYHTLPKLVYVPDDPRLGVYRETFGNQLMMFELRPDDDMSDFPSFGRSDDVVSSDKFYEEITDDNDHHVDAEAFVKARLFDMLLSDWDRHRLQWRWAEFDSDERSGKIYRPIPRDRDWAFNRFNGLLPSIMRIGIDPKFQEFDYEFGNIKGLTKNGLWQDRRLTATVERETWLQTARELQNSITDEVIEAAVLDWPQPIIDYHGEEVVAKLKARRDILHEAADTYYELLARYVDIVGTNKHERFDVERVSEDLTVLTVYKISKKGEVRDTLFQRTFHYDETNEIRLFGMDGNDEFYISGVARKGFRIRVIGGEGEDTFTDDSHIPEGGQKVIFYDSMAPTEISTGPNTKVFRSEDPGINAYEQRIYLHNARLPQLFFGRNSDDGLFLGGGLKFVTHGFRKLPFQSEQLIVGNVALRTGAFNVLYSGHIVDAIGNFDVLTELNYRSPKNIRNFYGLGNETLSIEDLDFYEAQFSTAKLSSGLVLSDDLGTEFLIGAQLYYVDLAEDVDRFESQAGISRRSFRDQAFAGLNSSFVIDITDHPANPKQGFIWENTMQLNIGLADSKSAYVPISSAFSFYISPSLSPQVTLATRFGGEHRIGDFPFFDASTVGGRRSVRGWRSNRFAGRTSFYTNTELRVKLFNYSTYVALGEVGILGFFDNGRVWTEAMESPGKVWHQGYGGGVWISMFDIFVINASMGFSEEDNIFDLKLGFLY